MDILIIDDDTTKYAEVRRAIAETLSDLEAGAVDHASNLSDAMRYVSDRRYDFIVLDLLVPYIDGGTPEDRAGIELLRQIRRNGARNRGTPVMGLSAYPESIDRSRQSFDEMGVLVIYYDQRESWKHAMRHVLRILQPEITRRRIVDFMIFTALEEERKGFGGSTLELVGDKIIEGLNVRLVRGHMNGREVWGAVVLLRQMGLVTATYEVTRALSVFRAKVVCMSGICAGFSERSGLGQIIIANPAWEYQAGKWSGDGFQVAPLQIPLNPRTRVELEYVCQRPDIVGVLEAGFPTDKMRPTTVAPPALAPFATGSAVVADAKYLQHVQVQHRKLAGIDMETYGLYFSCHESNDDAMHYFSCKAVVDFANFYKDDDIHDYGSYVSARMTLLCVERLLAID